MLSLSFSVIKCVNVLFFFIYSMARVVLFEVCFYFCIPTMIILNVNYGREY